MNSIKAIRLHYRRKRLKAEQKAKQTGQSGREYQVGDYVVVREKLPTGDVEEVEAMIVSTTSRGYAVVVLDDGRHLEVARQDVVRRT